MIPKNLKNRFQRVSVFFLLCIFGIREGRSLCFKGTPLYPPLFFIDWACVARGVGPSLFFGVRAICINIEG